MASTVLSISSSIVPPDSASSPLPSDTETRNRANAVYQNNVGENLQPNAPNNTLQARVQAQPNNIPNDARMTRVVNILYSA